MFIKGMARALMCRYKEGFDGMALGMRRLLFTITSVEPGSTHASSGFSCAHNTSNLTWTVPSR